MSDAIPDPLVFARDALALRGALVEDDLVLAPDDLARALRVPTELRLGEGGVPCGLGAPLLDALVGAARARTLVVAARLDLPAPKAGHGAALAERFAIRNGLTEVVGAAVGEATYVAAHVAFVAEADDRHEGVVHVVVNARDGAEPDAAFRALADGGTGPGVLAPAPHRAEEGVPDAALVHAGRHARIAVAARVAVIAASVERRHRRDHQRIVEYFGSMIEEARAPRRRQDPSAIAAKVSHLLGEREAKLRELDTRFAIRTTLAPVALLLLRVPAVTVALRIRRRKAEREIALRLPAGAQGLDSLPCDGCGQPTSRPAACDDRLHILCEACVPSAQGRPDCRACRGGATLA